MRNDYDQETGAVIQVVDKVGEIWWAAPDIDAHGKIAEYMQGAGSGGIQTVLDHRGGTDLVQEIRAFRGATDYFKSLASS